MHRWHKKPSPSHRTNTRFSEKQNYTHSENILIAMLHDHRLKIRELGPTRIKQARLAQTNSSEIWNLK